MLLVNWYSIFYWISVADGIKDFFDFLSNFATLASIVCLILMLVTSIGKVVDTAGDKIETDEEEKSSSLMRAWNLGKRWATGIFWAFFWVAVISWGAYVFTPSKKDALIIVAGGAVGNFITRDTSASTIPSEVMTLLRDKIRSEIKEVSLTKELQDTLSDLSREELINIIKQKK